MLFDFSEGQFDMAASVDAMLTRSFPPDRLRAAWESTEAVSTVWSELAEVGLFSIVVPEELDGGGGALDDIVLLLDRLGDHGVPGPVVETAVVAADVLTRHAGEEVQREWLPRISAGECVVALAVEDRPVAGGADADAVIALAKGRAALLPADRVEARAVESQDPTRRLAQVSWSEEAFEEGLLTEGAAARATALAQFGTGAILTGVNSRLITMTRDYLLERKQFGKTIGRFQALKHRLADALAANEAARSLVWSASHQLAEDTPQSRVAACLAKSSSSSASAITNAAALQLHGGIGFTWEHDLHLWLKRGKALEQAYGNHLEHRRRIGAAFLAREEALA